MTGRKCFYISGLKPLGICLYANHPYYMEQDAMTWGINYIGDDEAAFKEAFNDHWSGEKGPSYNITCWEVLHELAYTWETLTYVDHFHKPRNKSIYDAVPSSMLEVFWPEVLVLRDTTEEDVIPKFIDCLLKKLENELKHGAGQERIDQVRENIEEDELLADVREGILQGLQDLRMKYFC